jgi:hypothetical protein
MMDFLVGVLVGWACAMVGVVMGLIFDRRG